MTRKFDGKHVVITAGAAGIGYELAMAYERESAKVYVCDINEALINTLNEAKPNISGFVADVSRVNQVTAFIDFVQETTDKIDILINNAGIAGPTALTEQVLPEDWDKTIAVNLNGMFYASKYTIPLIKNTNGGSIVNIASSAAFSGYPYRSPYTASKWAVIGLTKTMAMELGPDHIRVNAVCPGSVEGPRIHRVIRSEAKERNISIEKVRKGYESQVSMRSFVQASDVVQTILFLTSEGGKMISGQVLGVDGHTETMRNF